ncbi:MAG: hydroxymethylbilane synthase [Chlorobi bacterium]|nr:hydroxymethylbilane synthase [Chlorobiota bacterium]
MIKNIKIGTRGSRLALYQANKTKNEILKHFPSLNAEIIVIRSKGDMILDTSLSKIGDKGLFTKELEEALLRKEIDIAVHSLKDLPTILPENLEISAVLKRGEVRDALVSIKDITVEDLKHKKITVATSSLRRRAQLLLLNPDLNIVDIRGNVDTRLRKLEEGCCDAVIMAATGLQRLNLDSYIKEIIDPSVIIPAVSQGAIAVESVKNNDEIKEIIAKINHETTQKITAAERIFLGKLEGGCQIPIACRTVINNDEFTMFGFMSFPDGTKSIKSEISGKLSEINQGAEKLADYFISKNSFALLEEIRNFNNSQNI